MPEAESQAQWRWFRFSLWAMFVWVTVIALLLTVGLRWIVPAQQQRVAVQMMERLGGSVRYTDLPTKENRLTSWIRHWLPRDFFDSVEQVEVLYTRRVVHQELRCLRSLPQLHDLSLEGSHVEAGCLQHLRGLPQLASLSLDGSHITDAELVHLSGISQIQKLDLRDTPVTNADLSHLRDLKQLKRLCLSRTNTISTGQDRLVEAVPGCSICLRF